MDTINCEKRYVDRNSGFSGNRELLDHIFSLAYEELRGLASRVRYRDPSTTLNPTALVNEAWLKLERHPEVAATSNLHFKRIAARAMRQLLVESARRRKTAKRGAGEILFVQLLDGFDVAEDPGQQLLAINDALDELAEMSPRQAAIVETRFFGGMDERETATMMKLSESTVRRDWRMAKAWLAQRLRDESLF
mgnify:FL=1